MKIQTLYELEELINEKLKNRQPLVLDPPNFAHSAVLIPIFCEDETIKFILTKRTDSLKHHKGEISFPGGRKDNKDENLIATALRETEEEIGVKKGQVKVIGRLDDLFTITRYIITPFIGIINEKVQFSFNGAEVAELLRIPMELFLTKEKFAEKNWVRNGTDYPLYYYYWADYEIWGATAYIINHFMEIIFDFQPSKINFKRNKPSLIEKFIK